MNITTLWGSITLGIVFNTLLYGVVLAGYFHYLKHHKNDSLWLRLYVLFLFVADSANTGLSIAFMFDCLVEHFGELSCLGNPTWLSTSIPAITGIISCAVQLFFTHRVRRLSRQTWLAVIIGSLAVISMLSALTSVIAIRWPGYRSYTSFRRPAVRVPVVVWLVTGLSADVLITIALVWHLHRKRTGFPSTDSLVNRIIRLTIQTGVLTTTWALVDVTLFLATPSTAHIFFNLTLAKLYTILLMSSLNMRGGWEPSYISTSELPWHVESGRTTQSLIHERNTDNGGVNGMTQRDAEGGRARRDTTSSESIKAEHP
ncbi:hypothetical protein WOLCODRAFT_106269 [Wolfiporia cocos MD-104 SS10]|uniref:DUF6534 domain-containing protein n=1 Tax=Wolfiporia cocos (strain MD-104) TaxID=742152 RepID=A0A2H3IYU5_WOLCO|nr:hypothetical protein WOLCODRAFT_106269 [Wolfiporia cocos MD-104 SS10]